MSTLLDGSVGLVVATSAFVCLAFLFLSGVPFVWLKARIAGVPVPLLAIIAMRVRAIPAGRVVDAYIICDKRGIGYSLERLQALYLSAPSVFEQNVISIVKSRSESE